VTDGISPPRSKIRDTMPAADRFPEGSTRQHFNLSVSVPKLLSTFQHVVPTTSTWQRLLTDMTVLKFPEISLDLTLRNWR